MEIETQFQHVNVNSKPIEAQQFRDVVATKDLPGPPYYCPECGVQYSDKRPLGFHRNQLHNVKSAQAEYSHAAYMKKKEQRKAAGLAMKSNKEIKYEEERERAVYMKNNERSVNGNTDEFAGHLAFTAGYITCFIETYAKGNGLSGTELTSGLAKFLQAKSR